MSKCETEPCTTIFSNGTECEWFIEHFCERCTRFRNGKCKVYNSILEAMFDTSKFPYEFLLDYKDHYAGKECKLFTDLPAKRKKRENPLEGQLSIWSDDA